MNRKIDSCERKIISLEELSYMFFVFIMFVMKGFGLYEGQNIYTVLFLLAFLCLGCKFLFAEYSYLEWVIIFLLGVLALIMNRVSGEKGPLVMVGIILGMKNVSLEKVVKLGAVSFGASTFLKVAYNLIFLPSSGYYQAPKLGMIECIRWKLGYAHPNTVAIGYLALATMVVYCLDRKYNWKHFIILNVGNLFLNFYCLSYTGMLITFGYLVLAYFAVHYRLIYRIWFWIIECVFPICVLFSVIIPFVIPDCIAEYIRVNFDTINSRLMLARMYFTPENISLWGVNVSTLTDSRFTLDNSYLYCFVFNGVVTFVLLCIGYLFMIHQYAKQRKQKELAIIVMLLFAGILEPFLFNTSFKNLSLFFLGACLSEKITSCEDKKNGQGIWKTVPPIIKVHELVYKYPSRILYWKWDVTNKDFLCLFGGSAIAMAAAFGVNKLIYIDESFFTTEMLEKFSLNNELSKAIILENMRQVTILWAGITVVMVVVFYVVRNWKECVKKSKDE